MTDVRKRCAAEVFAMMCGGSNDPTIDEMAACIAIQNADAALAALRPGDEIDLGEFGTVVLVPKEPTETMCEAAYEWRENGKAGERWVAAVKSPGDAYRAMLAAVKETAR